MSYIGNIEYYFFFMYALCAFTGLYTKRFPPFPTIPPFTPFPPFTECALASKRSLGDQRALRRMRTR